MRGNKVCLIHIVYEVLCLRYVSEDVTQAVGFKNAGLLAEVRTGDDNGNIITVPRFRLESRKEPQWVREQNGEEV